jgi:hypothetical protein
LFINTFFVYFVVFTFLVYMSLFAPKTGTIHSDPADICEDEDSVWPEDVIFKDLNNLRSKRLSKKHWPYTLRSGDANLWRKGKCTVETN